ncbi:MAG: hypothetical protein JXX29_02895 [Deltaproteobacteria bacterium]|nr:hypothetical protein [Deltaproteobacteria bacterium]MBN2670590.1 hypothetical protein [Deltaproteobacteria bacterium]
MKYLTLLKNKLFSSRENIAIFILIAVVLLVTSIVVYSEAYEPGRTIDEANFFGWKIHLTLKRYEYNAFLGVAGAIGALVCLVSVFIRKESLRAKRVMFVSLMIAAVMCMTVAPLKYCFLRNEYFDAGDTFCYFLGPKYFKELGYAVHYECAGAAQMETGTGMARYGRDLRTNTLKPISELITPRVRENCRERFSDERWKSYLKDVDTFRGWHGRNGWQRRFRDHGYNGSPVFQAFAGLIANLVELNHRNMVLLALLNFWLVLIMFVVVIRAFGWRFGLLIVIFFWSNFLERWFMGSSFLRHEWVMAIGLGLSFMKMQRYGLSGAAFAFAAGVRIFPVLLFVGIGIAVLWDLIHRRGIKREYVRFIVGAGITGVLLFIISVSHGHGFANWQEFLHQMELNSGRFSTMRVGFIYNFLWPREFLQNDAYVGYELRLANLHKPLFWVISADHIRWVVTAVICAFTVKQFKHLDDIAKSTLTAFLIFFMLLSTVHYYYSLFLGVPFMWHRYMQQTFGKLFMTYLLGTSALAYVVREYTYYSFPYNTYFTAVLTVFFIAVIVYFELTAKRDALGALPSEDNRDTRESQTNLSTNSPA